MNNREALEISTFMKNECEIYDRQDTIDCEDYSTNCLEFITKKFKLIEPVLKMVEAGLIVKVIYYFRNNFYHSDNVKEELKQILEYNRIEWEIISDQGSLCFLLQKSDENFKIIHLFSSEKQRAPDSTLRKEIKGSIKYINYHYTGSSLEWYGSTINRVINKLMKEVDGKTLKRFIYYFKYMQIWIETSII